jgi:hypothetical protein
VERTVEDIDIKGNLETIEHLAQIGQLLVEQDRKEHIPTILEDIYEHSQRLTFEYAVAEEQSGTE